MSATAEIIHHGEDSEIRHQPSGEQWWQESVFVAWHDPKAGLGGIIRLGHEPDYDRGISAIWFGVVSSDGTRFRRNVSTPLTQADLLDDGFGAMDARYRFTYDGAVRLQVDEDGCQMDLTVEDFYPRTDFFPSGAGTLLDDFASNHFEVSGRIYGKVQLDGVDHDIDGYCHRDHSWGIRRWDTLLNHRWAPGTFGPELSFGAIAWHAVDGTIRQYGYVVKSGEVIIADEVEIVAYMEPDATTFRGGSAAWTLPGGEVFSLEARTLDAFVFEHHGVASVESVSEVEHAGMSGFCDFAVSTNPRAGSGPITAALYAANRDGLSRREH